MIPVELRLSGVRAFGNHSISLGGPDVREVIMFGANGSGKSTIARMIQALLGDPPDGLYQGYLDERDTRVNRRASAELTVLNPKGEMWNPDWPDKVVLGLEFGYDNTRPFSRFYTVADGKKQVYRSHEDYAEIFRRTYNIKPDDRFMFIQQGDSAALVQMKPRLRYETMKQYLGLEDLERQWQETLDARHRAGDELRAAQNQRDVLSDGLRRKHIAFMDLERYRELSSELRLIVQRLSNDDLARHVTRLDRLTSQEKALALEIEEEASRCRSLEGSIEACAQAIRAKQQQSASSEALLLAARETLRAANDERQRHRKEVDELQAQINSIERVMAEGLSKQELEARIDGLVREIDELKVNIQRGQERERETDEMRSALKDSLGRARAYLERFGAEASKAEQTLSDLGTPETLDELLRALSPGLNQARQAWVLAAESERQANERVSLLESRRSTTPPAATSAAERYRDMGCGARVLCECVTPPDNASLEERILLEGALGDFRWAVLVDDGRVIVDYTEYTIADFAGCMPASVRTARDVLIVNDDTPPELRKVLETLLASVGFASGHEEAIMLASQGVVAYTPDGYRYDRYGRRYSVPEEMCLGPKAYASALEQAKRLLAAMSERASQEASRLSQVEREHERVRQALGESREALETLSRVRPQILAWEAEIERLSIEERQAAALLLSVREQNAQNQRAEVALDKELELMRRDLEKWARSDELPKLRQRLAESRESEMKARKAADNANDQISTHEDVIRSALIEISKLDHDVQIASAHLKDSKRRLDDLADRIDETRNSLRDLKTATGSITDAWRRAFDRPGVTDDEVLAEAIKMRDSFELASDEQRVTWTRRQSEIEPTVTAMRSAVILTAEEDYLSAKAQFDRAEAELNRVSVVYEDAAKKEQVAQENFRRVMLDTFHRINSRFTRYMEQFGWTGYLQVEPVQGTHFELNIYVSVYQGVEPRPLLRNRSGGETSAIAALLTLSMVKEYRRPFYVFDEIDQSLDPANVVKLASLFRQELDRKYIVISHRLNKTHLEQSQFGIGVYRSQDEGSRTRVYRRREWPRPGA